MLGSPFAEQHADENDFAPAACCPPRSTAGKPPIPNNCFFEHHVSCQKVATLKTLFNPPVYSFLPFKLLQASSSAATPLILMLGKGVRTIALENYIPYMTGERYLCCPPFSARSTSFLKDKWKPPNEGGSLPLLRRSLTSCLRLKRRITQKPW